MNFKLHKASMSSEICILLCNKTLNCYFFYFLNKNICFQVLAPFRKQLDGEVSTSPHFPVFLELRCPLPFPSLNGK